MKLYTEEQLLNTIKAVLEYDNEVRIEKYLKALQPIELPSDDEIESGMNKRLFLSDKHAYFNSGAKAGFKLGAKWMKEQILNQNK